MVTIVVALAFAVISTHCTDSVLHALLFATGVITQYCITQAIDEQYFADMYADLCVKLHNQSSGWAFVKVCTHYTQHTIHYVSTLPQSAACMHRCAAHDSSKD
jgi:hypothetical protein